MSESKKLWVAFGIVGVICCCMAGIGYWGVREFSSRVEGMANGDPTAVAQIQGNIADFDVPPGYQTMAMSMFIYEMVSLTPDDSSGGPIIILMQYSGSLGATREQMEQTLREAAEQQNRQSGISMQVVDSFETVIRGEPVTVTVSEGNAQGLVMRQWIAIFEGNNGPVIFMAQGIAQVWDDGMLNDFLRSIR